MIGYDNTSVRRQDRLLDRDRAEELLRRAEYGVLSLCDAHLPYGIPVNYVWDGDTALYIHCALQGRKLRAIEENPHASFCVVGRTQVLPRQFTTEYESILAQGVVRPVADEDEKRRALTLLLDKYSPDERTLGLHYMEKSLPRTLVLRLDIETLSGKCKKTTKTK